MSFSPQVYRKKLEALQETQESIVSISQWLLFHHRHCKELCDLWTQYILSDDPSVNLKKKLSLFYLCNDVVQQARHKRKPEFAQTFSKSLPGILHRVYLTVNATLQPKIDRLINVWEQRNIFDKKDILRMRNAIETLKNGQYFVSAEEDAPKPPPKVQLCPELAHVNDLYNRLTQLLDTSSANLSQVGVQCKLYLPQNPETQDNLPLPNVYLVKLNVLEKLCDMTKQNLGEVTSFRENIITVLGSLSNALNDALASDSSKIKIIEQRLERLHSIREELREIVRELAQDEHPQNKETEEDEEPSPAYDNASDSDGNTMPAYENSSDSEQESAQEGDTKRRRISDSPATEPTDASTAISSKSSQKSVAFSEDIQVKEFVQEEETNSIRIISSDGEPDDEEEDTENQFGGDYGDFSKHQKDDLELRHEKLENSEDDYEPAATSVDGEQPSGTEKSENTPAAGLLNLLSKLS
ncbi:DUF618-domain-containing protein [Metschnikowia bicuspidata]|uniref:DUF618-domain-containing protein n=1 Tax=Metschnikowia bicuspidata TaxID=27322 RepID=A0A4P9ZGP9_9ASCO|nr:DUF618-domain-containing protein [Metschnikowia bicuspidata]